MKQSIATVSIIMLLFICGLATQGRAQDNSAGVPGKAERHDALPLTKSKSLQPAEEHHGKRLMK